MEPLFLAAICAACFFGGLVQAVTGFGFGILVMTVFPYLMPSYVSAATLSMMLSMTTSICVGFWLRRLVDLRLLMIPLAGYALSNVFCIVLSASQPDGVLRRLLGLFLVLIAVWFVRFSERVKIAPSARNGFLAGLLSGALSGLFATGGPPMVIYLMAVIPEPAAYLANIQFHLAASSVFNLIVRILNGMVTKTVLIAWCFGIVAAMAGTLCGRKISSRLNPVLLKRLVYGFIAVSGAALLAAS